MARRCLAFGLRAVGFLSSVGFPLWAAASQVVLLRADCGARALDRLGVTAAGAVLVACLVGFTVWRLVATRLREVLRPRRTLFGFFAVGYGLILVLRSMLSSLEIIFLGGLVGTAVAVVCYALADRLREGVGA